MTVAEWYQTYNNSEYRDTYIVLPKHVNRRGKTNQKHYAFGVELYINVGQVHFAHFTMALHKYSPTYLTVRSSNWRPWACGHRTSGFETKDLVYPYDTESIQ